VHKTPEPKGFVAQADAANRSSSSFTGTGIQGRFQRDLLIARYYIDRAPFDGRRNYRDARALYTIMILAVLALRTASPILRFRGKSTVRAPFSFG
jgi:hypothetical protein